MSLQIKAFSLLAVLALAACNTVEGAGEDISTAGSVIQQEARAAQ